MLGRLVRPLLVMLVLSAVPLQAQRASRPPQNERTPFTAAQTARRALPSVVLVETDCGRGRISLGSGFVVERGLVATNKHVVRCDGVGYVTLFGQGAKHAVTAKYLDAARDLAILKVEGLNAPALLLRDMQSLVIGEKAYAAGNPQGLEGTFSDGIISGLRLAAGLIQFTAAISPGSSGGPVIDEYGRVVGVTVSFVTSGQNLNFAVPASFLRTLVADVRDGKVSDALATGNRPTTASPSEAPPTSTPTRRAGALNYTLIIDTSRTLGEQFVFVKQIARTLVERNASDDGTVVMSFRSSGARRTSRLATDRRVLLEEIDTRTARSDSQTQPVRDALISAIESATHPHRQYDMAGVVVITHGMDGVSVASWEELRAMAREHKVPLYCVLFAASLGDWLGDQKPPDLNSLSSAELKQRSENIARWRERMNASEVWMKLITQESGGKLFIIESEQQLEQFPIEIMRALHAARPR